MRSVNQHYKLLLCVKISNKMGAEVTIQDINVAHRVNSTNISNRPKLIVCKFTRHLAREVTKRRSEISWVALSEVGLLDAAASILYFSAPLA